MKRKMIALMTAAALMLSVSAGAAVADPKCVGKLSERPASCFNTGPESAQGFHGSGK